MSTSVAVPPASPVRSGATRAFLLLMLLFLALGVVQVFLAGYGVYALDGDELGTPGETAYDPHRIVAMVMSAVVLLALIAVIVARPGRFSIVMTVVLVLLTLVVQGVLADLGEDVPFVGGLHALDGLAILGIAGVVHGRLSRAVRSRTAATSGAATPSSG
jgi:hypothetical protein